MEYIEKNKDRNLYDAIYTIFVSVLPSTCFCLFIIINIIFAILTNAPVPKHTKYILLGLFLLIPICEIILFILSSKKIKYLTIYILDFIPIFLFTWAMECLYVTQQGGGIALVVAIPALTPILLILFAIRQKKVSKIKKEMINSNPRAISDKKGWIGIYRGAILLINFILITYLIILILINI